MSGEDPSTSGTREDVDASETQSFTRVAFSNCLKDDTDVASEEAVCTRFGLKVLGKESSLSVLCTSYPERVQTCQPKKIAVKTPRKFSYIGRQAVIKTTRLTLL